MRQNKTFNHFKQQPTDPQPLESTAVRRVRFEEVDAMRIVWHGRYAGFLEDGRAAFGARYGIGYDDMMRENFMAPIVQMHIEYHRPLRFNEEFTIHTRLHWTEAVKMNFSYQLLKNDGNVAATAYTVQVLTDMDGRYLLSRPPYVSKFCRRWQEGELI